MGRKKLTKQQIKDKAKAAAKRITHGKIMAGIAIGGPVARRLWIFSENKDPVNFSNGIVNDQTGLDLATGEFQLDGLKRGYSGALTYAAEKAVFKAAGVKGPRSKIKTKGDVLDYISYHGAAVAAASIGRDPRDKFQRYYEVAFGHNLETNENQFFMTATRKWLPYIAQKKIRKFLNV